MENFLFLLMRLVPHSRFRFQTGNSLLLFFILKVIIKAILIHYTDVVEYSKLPIGRP